MQLIQALIFYLIKEIDIHSKGLLIRNMDTKMTLKFFIQ